MFRLLLKKKQFSITLTCLTYAVKVRIGKNVLILFILSYLSNIVVKH